MQIRLPARRDRTYLGALLAFAIVASVTTVDDLVAQTTGRPESDGSQRAAPTVASRLLGEWRGRGTVTGRASEIAMTWDRAVGDAFLSLRFRNEMAASATRPAEVFEGHGYYRVSSSTNTGTGTWIDSRGMIMPVTVVVTPDALTSDWGGDGTEAGRTVYRLISDGTLEVLDFVRGPQGDYREFGRSRLERR